MCATFLFYGGQTTSCRDSYDYQVRLVYRFWNFWYFQGMMVVIFLDGDMIAFIITPQVQHQIEEIDYDDRTGWIWLDNR